MADHSKHSIIGATGRGVSPALSDFSELTILSRSPSPVLDYNVSHCSLDSDPVDPGYVEQKLRGQDGRYVSRKTKRAHSPDGRPTKKTRSIDSPSSTPRTPRKRREALEHISPTPEPRSPVFWVIGQGGFGTIEVLPKEIRQTIFAYALEIGRVVTVKECCGPDTTTRERDACRKHGTGMQFDDGRFTILLVSKAMSHEASWVLHNQGSLLIALDWRIKSYLDKDRSRNLRHLGSAAKKIGRKTGIWAAAARFRFIRIDLPMQQLTWGDPQEYTGHLVGVACLLGKCWEDRCTQTNPTSSPNHDVKLDIRNIFHEMLPFNMESRGEENYEYLLDWIAYNHRHKEPDFDKIAAVSQSNLKKLASVLRLYQCHAQWTIIAQGNVPGEDEGGIRAMMAFSFNCARNGVVVELSE